MFAGRYQFAGSPPTGGSRQAMRSTRIPLDPLVGPRSSKNEGVANVYASDGSVVGGWSFYDAGLAGYRQATYWVKDDNDEDIPAPVPFLGNNNYSEVTAINGDGAILAGYGYFESAAFEGEDGPRHLFLWARDGEVLDLQDLLENLAGLDLGGMTLTQVTGLSDDGRTLCGNGKIGDTTHAWVARLPALGAFGACCRPDTTCRQTPESLCSGRWHGPDTACDEVNCCPDPAADTDEDHDVDQRDFAAFQLCFTDPLVGTIAEGCGCFDFDDSQQIDADDLTTFVRCAAGPTVLADPACDDGD